jgi:hypothetical protein
MPDPSDEKLARLERVIGRLTINFAQLEIFLNINLTILNRKHAPIRLARNAAISRRLEAFRRGVAHANITDFGKERGHELADQIAVIIDTRHTCTHGVIAFTEVDDFDPMGVTFDRMDPASDTFARGLDHLFIGDIEKAATSAYQLSVKLMGFTAILDHDLVDGVKQALRELIG